MIDPIQVFYQDSGDVMAFQLRNDAAKNRLIKLDAQQVLAAVPDDVSDHARTVQLYPLRTKDNDGAVFDGVGRFDAQTGPGPAPATKFALD